MEQNLEQTEQKPLILIVDDIPKNLQVLSNILNTEGYQISFASNGEQALTVVKTTIPDLILLDVMMPVMDGFEVCKRLKNDPVTASIPIIFLTGKIDSDDKVKGLKLGAVDYVTKPFNATELLTRLNTHLELKYSRDKIIKINEELKLQQDELKTLNANKDKFFSLVAHDLRGPFSGFLSLSELLADEYDSLDRDEIAKIGDSMNKAAKRLFNLIENLLEWSRSQMGKIEINPTTIDIKDSVQRVISIYTASAKNKSIEINSFIEDENFAVADNNMFNTILRNLISNAIKFCFEYGEINIYSDLSEDGNFYEVSVQDSGIGIPKDALDKIFRIDSKHTTLGTAKEQGTGLGLILCKDFVEKNGGNIWVKSVLGDGTTFTFSIPKANI